MFRNRQPAWPYRCTGKDARTGVFFFALRAGAARAFPAAGHAHGREAASPAENTAARPKFCARRRSCASNPSERPMGRCGRRHRRQRTRRHDEGRRAAQIVRAQPARVPHGGTGSGISGSEHGGAAEVLRAAQTVRAQPARAPRGMARAAASPAGNTAARRRPARGADRVRQTLPDGAKRQSLAIITILNHISKHCQENRRCRAPAMHPTTAGCFNSNTRR